MSTNPIVPHLDTGHTYDASGPMRATFIETDLVLYPGSPAPRHCETCGTLTQMCLAAAAYEEEGRNVVPAPCAVCGGYTLAPESPKAGALVTVAALVALLTVGQPCAWAIGQRAYASNPAYAYAAIIGPEGVSVWRCNDAGWLDRYLGRVNGHTTRADVWRMRQQMAWVMAAETGLVAR